jgi:hypothetical protein
MSQKKLKLGWVLVLEGVITRQQLDKVLDVRRLHKTKSIGEIVNKLFSIPEGKVESIFVREVLIPTISESLYKELRKTKTTQEIDIKELVPTIAVKVSKFHRNTNSSKLFTFESPTFFQPSSQKGFLSTIDCTIDKLEIKTRFDANIEFKDVELEYDLQNQTISWENPAILLEAKIRLNQIIKKNL